MDAGKDSALLNACVLGRLFEFVDIESLKKCRLVCHTWNTFAGSSLRKRSITIFDCEEKRVKFQKDIAAGIGSNSKIFKNFYFDLVNPKAENPHILRILTDFRTIESLEFDLFDQSGFNVNIINALLLLPNLTTLTLTRIPANTFCENPFEGRKFQKLKCCSLDIDESEELKASDDPRNDLVILLLQSCQNTLQTLQLPSFPLKHYEALLEAVNLQGLTHLQLGSWELDDMDIPVDILKRLISKCPLLKTFECNFQRDASQEVITEVLACLTTVKNIRIRKEKNDFADYQTMVETLPTLAIVENFTLDTVFGGDVRDFSNRFFKVKKLELILIRPAYHGWKIMPSLEELAIDDQYTSIDDFRTFADLTQKNFPRLTKLTIKLHGGNASYIFESLKTLKELIISDESKAKDYDITGISEDKLLCGDDKEMIGREPYIGDLPCLQVLYVGSRKITNLSLAYGICDVKNLTHLTLCNPEVGLKKVEGGEGKYFYDKECKGNEKFDLKSFMLPRLPNLVRIDVLTTDVEEGTILVDEIQLQDMRRSRLDFSYSQREKLVEKYNDY